MLKDKMRNVINESTSISVGLLITLVGGIFWLSTLYAKTEATAKAVERIEIRQNKYNDTVGEINERLSRIEGAMSRDRRNR